MYICEGKKHLVGTPELRLKSPAVDENSSVPSAKLKSSYSKCRVLLEISSTDSTRKDWQIVEVKDTQYTQFGFSLADQEYLWVNQRRPPCCNAAERSATGRGRGSRHDTGKILQEQMNGGQGIA